MSGPPSNAEAGSKRPSKANRSLANLRRKRRRKEAVAREGHVRRQEVLRKHVKPAQSVAVELDLLQQPVTAGAYSAKNQRLHDARKAYTADELVEEQCFRLIFWDGR